MIIEILKIAGWTLLGLCCLAGCVVVYFVLSATDLDDNPWR